jgi:hypothetical protein
MDLSWRSHVENLVDLFMDQSDKAKPQKKSNHTK